jgi:hypothetical protein
VPGWNAASAPPSLKPAVPFFKKTIIIPKIAPRSRLPFSPQKFRRLNPYITRPHTSQNSHYSPRFFTFREMTIYVYRHENIIIWQGSMKCKDMARLAGEMQILYCIVYIAYTHTCCQNVVSCVSISLSLSISVDIISLIISIVCIYTYITRARAHTHTHTHTHRKGSREI